MQRKKKKRKKKSTPRRFRKNRRGETVSPDPEPISFFFSSVSFPLFFSLLHLTFYFPFSHRIEKCNGCLMFHESFISDLYCCFFFFFFLFVFLHWVWLAITLLLNSPPLFFSIFDFHLSIDVSMLFPPSCLFHELYTPEQANTLYTVYIYISLLLLIWFESCFFFCCAIASFSGCLL